MENKVRRTMDSPWSGRDSYSWKQGFSEGAQRNIPKMTLLSKVIDNEHMQNITLDFNRLQGRCYLEHAGAALYPQSLIQSAHEDLMTNVYMNPHTDKFTKDCIEQIRCLILNHFHTDSSKYSVIFTSGATQGLKLTLESFQFTSNAEGFDCGSFVYLNENHTSVLGLRELVDDKNVDIINISHENFLKSVKQSHPAPNNKQPIQPQSLGKMKIEGNILLTYPAESNFNGYKYPLDCIQNIKNGCLNRYLMEHLCQVNCNWYVLLDAAAYVPTQNLDLSKVQPDFVSLSFYKIFGYPTGLGALLVKNSSSDVLCKKRYFGGGTVDIVLSGENFHVKRKTLHERLEDGTLPFLSILALKHCFDMLHRLIPKTINNHIMETIAHHTFHLAKDLYNQLKELQHPNGKKAVVLYMDSDFSDIKAQGGVVTFNLVREDGSHIGYVEFQNMADLFNINVRTGCFCNSGSCQRHLGVTNKDMKDMYKAGHKCGDEIDLINGYPTGAIRASFGYYNTFDDVDKFMSMVCRCFVRTKFEKPNRVMAIQKDISVRNPSSKQAFKESVLNLINNRAYFDDYDILPGTLSEDGEMTLDEIAIFPIKSCGAFKVKTCWKIGAKGFEFDREWMIVRENGVCLTQKQCTQMCMIKPEIDLTQKHLKLHFKGKHSISIPIDPITDNKAKSASLCTSRVCMDMVHGYDCGDKVADWISNALGISFLRLIRQSNTEVRIQRKNNEGDQKLLSLSNQAQFLLINKASVKWLYNRIKDPLFTADLNNLVDRFRGNLIIDAIDELVEREWQNLTIGQHEFKVEGPCQRCHMICINQESGEKTAEPLRTISEQFAGKLRFGIYLSYVGPINGLKDKCIKVNSQVKPIAEDDISR